MKDFVRIVVIPSLGVLVFSVALAIPISIVIVKCSSEPKEVQKFGPDTGPPADAPTLDYEAMVGLDPQTQLTNEERVRIDKLERRVEVLERMTAIGGKGNVGQLSSSGSDSTDETSGKH